MEGPRAVARVSCSSKTDKVKQMERVDKGRGGTYLGDGSKSRGMASSTAHFLRRRGWHGLEYGLPQLLRETASVSAERGRGMHTRTERIAACRAERGIRDRMGAHARIGAARRCVPLPPSHAVPRDGTLR